MDDSSCNELLIQSVKQKLQSLVNFRANNIIDCLFLSTKTGEGVKNLVNQLIQTALAHKMLKQLVPNNYYLLDQLLMKERQKHQWVRWAQYLRWVNQCNINKENVGTVTRFLHDVGTLIYFDTQGLRDIVILDPQWLANIMASLVTFNHHWIKDGILNTIDLEHIWKQYPKSLYSKLIMLLSKFQVIAPLRQSTPPTASLSSSQRLLPPVPTGPINPYATQPEIINDSGNDPLATCYIIPSFLAEQTPDKASMYWNKSAIMGADCKKLEFTRVYIFDFTFEFSKILVTLLHAPNMNIQCFWRYGIIAEDVSTPDSQESLFFQWLPSSSQLKLSFRINKIYFYKHQKFKLLRQMIEMIDSIIEGFYFGAPNIVKKIGCSHCNQRENSILEGVYLFEYDYLVDCISNGQWIVFCRNVPSRPVNVKFLAPDISLCDFPIIQSDQLEIIKEVGRGGFGVVYKANLLSKYPAAVKELLLTVGNEDSLDNSDKLSSFFSSFLPSSHLLPPISFPSFSFFPFLLVSPPLPYPYSLWCYSSSSSPLYLYLFLYLYLYSSHLLFFWSIDWIDQVT